MATEHSITKSSLEILEELNAEYGQTGNADIADKIVRMLDSIEWDTVIIKNENERHIWRYFIQPSITPDYALFSFMCFVFPLVVTVFSSLSVLSLMLVYVSCGALILIIWKHVKKITATKERYFGQYHQIKAKRVIEKREAFHREFVLEG